MEITINCHSSIRIEEKKVFYFDPYKIEEEKHDADYIFLTHNHYDHFDKSSIENIKTEKTKFIVPFNMKEEVKDLNIPKENIITVVPNAMYSIDKYQIETVPSYNIDKDFHPKSKDWCGYIIVLENERYYIAGDTDFIPEMKKIACDVAFLPIGGTYTMTPEEAALCANTICPKKVIPTHYNCVVGTLEDAKTFKENLEDKIECITIIE